VRKADYVFLYKLLVNRNPNENISHKKIPTYRKHVKFVMSKPYSRWYIIYHDKQKAGSIYLSKEHEIGIHLKKIKQSKKIMTYALKILIEKNPRKSYLLNISPKNAKLIQFARKYGFKPIQYTYELSIRTRAS